MRALLGSTVLLTLALVACEPGPEADTGEAATVAEMPADATGETAEAAMTALRDDWRVGFEADDATAVAALYADDAVYLTPDGRRLGGRDAIASYLAESFPAMSELEINSTRTFTGEDIAVDVGEYTASVTAEGGEASEGSGFYTVVTRRQADGSWKIVSHMSSSTEPQTEAQPAATGGEN